MNCKDIKNTNNRKGCQKLCLPKEYKPLIGMLYDLADGINGPSAGTTMVNYPLPDISGNTLEGTTLDNGFVSFVAVNEGPAVANGIDIDLNYDWLIHHLEWEIIPLESAKNLEISFLTYLSAPNYDPDRVYPMIDMCNNFTIYDKTKGHFKIEYYDQIYVHVSGPASVQIKFKVEVPPPYYDPEVTGKTIQYLITDCGKVPVYIQELQLDGTITNTILKEFREVAKKIQDKLYCESFPYPYLIPTPTTLALQPRAPPAPLVYNNLPYISYPAGYFMDTTTILDRRDYPVDYAKGIKYFGIFLPQDQQRSFHAVIDWYIILDQTLRAEITVYVVKSVEKADWRYHTYNGNVLSQSFDLVGTNRISGQFILQSDADAFGLLAKGAGGVGRSGGLTITFVNGHTP